MTVRIPPVKYESASAAQRQALDEVKRALLEGRKGLDAARALELTPGHVAVLLHRAKEHLRLCLGSGEAAAA